jgi:hypothetical protein
METRRTGKGHPRFYFVFSGGRYKAKQPPVFVKKTTTLCTDNKAAMHCMYCHRLSIDIYLLRRINSLIFRLKAFFLSRTQVVK